ncbi:MAG: GH1 family beta-glucosidase [Leptolyngbyaceae cyanobacterium bins.59]|nr:GH1 family beta-glucosidase [Leptolyngbyaceae cyanobacterium bins.59]
MISYQFPDDFQWGVATAAYQIEGATEAGGRKPSVWDTFCTILGRVANGDSGRNACDHYHRYETDIELMAHLGVKHYRFSIAWPRIFPEGRGSIQEAGIDFYQRLVDCLLRHHITPHCTLFHWDSPQTLEERYGSWRSREMAQDYADYVTTIVQRLGDRVTRWITLNEIQCFTHLGYSVHQNPPHAPGTRVNRLREVWQTSHHALLAHGLGCQAVRAASPVPCQVGLVDNPQIPVPIYESPEHIAAAHTAFSTCNLNGGILIPALTGTYHPTLLSQLGREAPLIQPGDLEIIHQPLDFLGLNIYTGVYVRAIDGKPGYEILNFSEAYPRLHMPWLHLLPDALYWGVRHISEALKMKYLPIYMTENGCAAQDVLTPKGEVLDMDRILYLREYLRAAQRAVNEGYPLKGYFLWSLLDNFEWAWGYERRFGITYVDYRSQKRTPKASFSWYRECVRQNRVV